MGKTKVLIAAMLLTLASCAPATQMPITVDFQPYVEAFKTECAHHSREIPEERWNALTIVMGQPSNPDHTNAVGLCEVRSDTLKVTISPIYWAWADEGRRYQLIFHELGHCLLGFTHRGDLSHGAPTSIMYALAFDGNWFEAHLNHYLAEYFSQ